MKKIVITLLLALMAMPLSSSVNTASAKTIASEQVADKKPKKKAEKKKKDLKTLVLSADIHCKSCSNKIMENIAFEKGIKDLKVSVPEKKITVKYDASKTNEEAILEAFRKIGYPAVVVERK